MQHAIKLFDTSIDKAFFDRYFRHINSQHTLTKKSLALSNISRVLFSVAHSFFPGVSFDPEMGIANINGTIHVCTYHIHNAHIYFIDDVEQRQSDVQNHFIARMTMFQWHKKNREAFGESNEGSSGVGRYINRKKKTNHEMK